MVAIVTLTMNPTVDIATSIDHLIPTSKMRCSAPEHDPGGGGLNVARVAVRLGESAEAIFPVGGTTGMLLQQLIEREGVPTRTIDIAGLTRESFSVTEQASGQQYRFVLPGPTLDDGECRAILDVVGGLAQSAGYLVISGSLPPGAPEDFYAQAARRAGDNGIRAILDSSGPPLKAAVEDGSVFLIKPSRSEFEGLTGQRGQSDDALLDHARGLIDRGRVEAVFISLGGDGALLITRDAHRFIRPPPVELVSAVGAGDSLVGALTVALARGWSLSDAACFGVAAGSAALATPGTELCRREDVERLYGIVCGNQASRLGGKPDGGGGSPSRS